MSAQNKRNRRAAATALLAALACGAAPAQEPQQRITEAEARSTRDALMAVFKAKGAKALMERVNHGPECKLKDIGCVVANDAARVLAARQPALVGQDMSEATDADGHKLAQAMVIGPLRAGKASWELSLRMGRAGGKGAVLRHYLCSRLDDNTALCVGYTG